MDTGMDIAMDIVMDMAMDIASGENSGGAKGQPSPPHTFHKLAINRKFSALSEF